MTSHRPRIAIPVPASIDAVYTRQCLPLYLEAVERSGGVPVSVPLDGSARRVAESCAAVLLPGSLADVSPEQYGMERGTECGPPDFARELADWTLLEEAFRRGKPVLGICYGLQSLNVWYGGSLLQHLAPMPVNHAAGASVAVAHTAHVTPASALAALVDSDEGELPAGTGQRLPVNSSHHQAVASVGDTLRVSARCPHDGVIEAMESADPSSPLLLGVQWHPERSFSSSATSRALFAHLVAAAARN